MTAKGAIRNIEKFSAAALRRRTERFDGCFPRGITMGDIDSHVEINHHWLFIEYKLGNQTIAQGQWLDLKRLSERPRMSVWIIWTTEDGFITHGQILGRHTQRVAVTEDAITQRIKDWVADVEKTPIPKSIDLALDRLEVAARLDAMRAQLLTEAISVLRDEVGAK